MKILINYADLKYQPSRKWNSLTGKYIANFDKIYSFTPEDISQEFRTKYDNILSFKRGNGLWLWKPYFVHKVITQCQDGDIIFYCDSGSLFIRKLSYVFNNLSNEDPMFCCDIPLLESCFTKPICFEKMNCNEDYFIHSNQIIATFFGLYVCNKTRRFVEEWLQFCCDLELMYPEGQIMNLSQSKGDKFVAHREDQSIFSLLCKKYKFTPHRDISQRGKDPMSYYNPNYTYRETNHEKDKKCKTLIFLHKSPNLGIIFFIKMIIKNIIYHFNKLKIKFQWMQKNN